MPSEPEDKTEPETETEDEYQTWYPDVLVIGGGPWDYGPNRGHARFIGNGG